MVAGRPARLGTSAQRRSGIVRLAALLVASGTILAHAAPLGSSVRFGSETYVPGQTLTLTNQLAPLAQVSIYSLTEYVPTGWTVGAISDGGLYDASRHWVRWLFMDSQVRVVTCQFNAPTNASGSVVLNGVASFDGQSVPVSGLSTVRLEPPPSGALTRRLPASYRAGLAVTITLRATPDPEIGLYGVEEILPAGWNALSLGGGTLSPAGTIRWGPFLDATVRELSYTLLAPAGSVSNVIFRGSGWFDTNTVPTSGDSTMASAPPGGGSVSRTLPAQYAAGQVVTVSLIVQPNLGTEVHAVLETQPAGWVATNISHFGWVSADGRLVRWGPFLDPDSRTLTYEVIAPAAAHSNAVFSGMGQFDGVTVSTVGQVSLPWLAPEFGTVTRSLPPTCRPGQTVWITNLVAPDSQVGTYALEEVVPAGWLVTDVGGGTYLSGSQTLRWGPFFEPITNVLIWQVMAPTNASGQVSFTGTAWFESVRLPVGGSSNLLVVPLNQGVALRSLPGYFEPGVAFPASIALSPEPGVAFCVVEETLPVGWQVSAPSHGGFFLPELRRLRWGPFTDDEARTLTFTLTPPSNARGSVSFSGQAYFDEMQTTTLGANLLAADSPPTWSPLPDQTAHSDTPLTLTFMLTDDETPSDQLQVSVASADESLLPQQNLALGWIGSTRSLTISPQPDREGQTTLTLTGSDGRFTRQESFVLTLRTPPRLTLAPTDQLVQLGGMASFAAAAVGSAPLAYQWQRDGVNLAGGEGPSLTLTNVLTNQAGLYRVLIANDVNAITSGVARLTVNSPPAPGQFTLSTYRNAAKAFSAAKLARVALDVDGDALLVTAVSASSTNGGTVQLVAGWVTYTPPLGYTGADAFTYTLSDDRGGSAPGTVPVLVEASTAISLNRVYGPVLENGNFVVRFAGLPGATYTIEYTDSISPVNWLKAINLTAPTAAGAYGRGVFQFRESASGVVSRYYRTVYPAY